ncbi:MAG: hypothetical protein KGS72_26750 [Cyanobacteria bacterium REEB67]|nr:hypothetical protein [Cyanobacteria bacterium REEB67]
MDVASAAIKDCEKEKAKSCKKKNNPEQQEIVDEMYNNCMNAARNALKDCLAANSDWTDDEIDDLIMGHLSRQGR